MLSFPLSPDAQNDLGSTQRCSILKMKEGDIEERLEHLGVSFLEWIEPMNEIWQETPRVISFSGKRSSW